jgi:AcrR family transcriptional regulator
VPTPARPGDAAAASGTRELIARHARTMFDDRGYAATSVRAIAAAAGVDPALVIRHFGSKEMLFVSVTGLADHPGPELDGPVATLGTRLVGYVLAPERAAMRRTLTTLVRASDYDSVRTVLRETTRRLFVDELARRLSGPDAELRAQLVATQLGGLVQAWSVIEDEHLTEADRSRVVELYGSAVQRLVDPPAG